MLTGRVATEARTGFRALEDYTLRLEARVRELVDAAAYIEREASSEAEVREIFARLAERGTEALESGQ